MNTVPTSAAPAVSPADVEKAILSRRWGTNGPDSQGFDIIHIRSAVDAVCDLLGIEAEATVDPVEEKARELYGVANAGVSWDAAVKSADDGNRVDREVVREYRTIARHVLGQEATR